MSDRKQLTLRCLVLLAIFCFWNVLAAPIPVRHEHLREDTIAIEHSYYVKGLDIRQAKPKVDPTPSTIDFSLASSWKEKLRTIEGQTYVDLAKKLLRPSTDYEIYFPGTFANNAEPRLLNYQKLQSQFPPNDVNTELNIEHLVEGQTLSGMVFAPVLQFRAKYIKSPDVIKALDAIDAKKVDFTITPYPIADGSKRPGHDINEDKTITGNTFEIVGDLLNGQYNLEILDKTTNNYKRNRVPMARGGGTNSISSDIYKNKAITSNGLAYVTHIGAKMEHSAFTIGKAFTEHAARIQGDSDLREALDAAGYNGAAVLTQLESDIVGEVGEMNAHYKKGGKIAQLMAADIVEFTADAPDDLQATFQGNQAYLALKAKKATKKAAAAAASQAGKVKVTKTKKQTPYNKPKKTKGSNGSCSKKRDLSGRDGSSCDEHKNMINERFEKVDEFGNRIDPNGYSRDKDNNYVSQEDGITPIDMDGNLVNSQGQTIDRNGNPAEADPEAAVDRSQDSGDEPVDPDDGPTEPTDNSPISAICSAGSRGSCAQFLTAIDAKVEGEELEWGFTSGGSEEREALIALEDSQFFAETETGIDGKPTIKKDLIKKRLRLFPRAVRDEYGKIARVKETTVGEQPDVIESTASGNQVKNDPYGAPFENYGGEVTPYAGILDEDMNMARYIKTPDAKLTSDFGYTSQGDLHGTVTNTIKERFAAAARGESPLTKEQGEGYLKYLGHMKKAVKARKNRVDAPLPAGAEAKIAGRSDAQAANFAKLQVNALEDSFNDARGEGDAHVSAAQTAAECGAACEKFEHKGTLRYAVKRLSSLRGRVAGCGGSSGKVCNRKQGKVLSPSTVSVLGQMKGILGDRIFKGDVKPNRPPGGDGKWIANDVVSHMGDEKEGFEGLWTELGEQLSSTMDVKLTPSQVSEISTMMNAWEMDIASTIVTEDNVNEHLNAVQAYNNVAAVMAENGYTGSGIDAKLRPVTPIDYNVPAGADTSTEARDLSDFAKAVKAGTKSAKVLPKGEPVGNPKAGDLYEGATTQDEATDAMLHEIEEALEKDSEVSLDEDKKSMMGKWRNFINKQRVRLLRKSDQERSRESVADHDIHVESYNKILRTVQKTYKSGDTLSAAPMRNDADLRPVEHISSTLAMDTIEQAKALSGSASILPDAGGTRVDQNGDFLPSSLYAGSRTMNDAMESVQRTIAASVRQSGGDDGSTLSKEKKILFRRIRNNLSKIARARQGSLFGNVKKGNPVDQKDIDQYSNDFGNSNRYNRYKTSFNDVKGQTSSQGSDGVSSTHPNKPDTLDKPGPVRELSSSSVESEGFPSQDSFPSNAEGTSAGRGFSSTGVGAAPADFTKYKNVINGPRVAGAIRKFKKLVRRPIKGVTSRGVAGSAK
ncbi:hypothetical protein DFJ77DRAFT_106955 [Powellomyces hirtus]|nr:hypothetical protein DFJ77DRAFT_106955 [Powellomyces hirtus]